MFVNVSPAEDNCDETNNSLTFVRTQPTSRMPASRHVLQQGGRGLQATRCRATELGEAKKNTAH